MRTLVERSTGTVLSHVFAFCNSRIESSLSLSVMCTHDVELPLCGDCKHEIEHGGGLPQKTVPAHRRAVMVKWTCHLWCKWNFACTGTDDGGH